MKARLIRSTDGQYFIERQINPCSQNEFEIEILTNKHRQQIIGFGGAFTHSSLLNYHLLNEELKNKFNELLYGKSGLRYNAGRIPVGSCDFTPSDFSYSLNKDLSDFSIYPHENDTIEYIHYLKKNYNLKYLKAAVWSPLPFFKDSSSKFEGKLLYDFYPRHALYVAKFIKAFKDENIIINYLSINNEPEAKVIWERCEFSVKEEANLAKYYKQYLEKEGCFDTKLCIFDHNYDHLYTWVDTSFSKYNSLPLFDGICYHWYGSEDFINIKKLYEKYNDKIFILSETCIEDYKNEGSLFKGAIRYFRNYLNNINCGTMLFLDWNILLNEEGGINHVGNNCESPVMYDRNNKELIVNPSYYAIKHFSHFIDEEAYALEVKNNNADLSICACENKKSYIINVLNEKDINIDTVIKIDNDIFTLSFPSKSLNTLVVEKR